MDKITTIICNYNHEKYLLDAMKSIAKQTYENMDVFVIDDGSDIDPKDIVDSVNWDGKQCQYIRNNSNVGKWHCLNTVIQNTNSQWYMIQDADDYAYPWKAKCQLACLKKTNTLLNLAGYNSVTKGEDHTVPINYQEGITVASEIINKHAMISLSEPMIKHNYTGQYDLHNGATMFSRVFHDIGFRFNPPSNGLRITMSEDSDFNLRATLQFQKTSWLDTKCYSYRLGSGHPEGSF